MLQATLSGQALLDPIQEAINLSKLGRSAPPEFAKTNCFVNPLGREPAMGWLLISRASLNALNLNALHTLIFNDGRNRVAVQNLVITREPVSLTASNVANDPKAAYIIEVADARWRCQNPDYCVAMGSKSFNVVAPAFAAAGLTSTSAYYANTLFLGSIWSWTDVVQYIWGLLTTQLGAVPASLPYAPDGTPANWSFMGSPAWGALCDVLDKIDCAVRFDPIANTYTIVQVGAADATAAAAMALAEGQSRKIGDTEPIAVARGRVAAQVLVYFQKTQQWAGSEESATNSTSQWLAANSYPVISRNVLSPYSGTEPGTSHIVFDDLPAFFSVTGTLLNGTAMLNRATEIANNYYNSIYGVGGGRMHKTYSGIVPMAPGGTIRAVAWRQDEGGAFITEVIRTPQTNLPATGAMAKSLAVVDEYADKVSLPLQAPRYAPIWPVWPPLVQTIGLTSAVPTGNLYSASIARNDNPTTPTWTAREAVLALDLNLSPGLTIGKKYLARLIAFSGTKPVYAFCSSGVSVQNIDIINIITNTINNINVFNFVTEDFTLVDNTDGSVTISPIHRYDWTAHYDVWTGFNGIKDVSGGTTYWSTVTAKRWHIAPAHVGGELASSSLFADYLYAVPYIDPSGRSITSMGIGLTTDVAGSGSGYHLRFGVYEQASITNKFPGNLVWQSGSALDMTAWPFAAAASGIVVHDDTVAANINPSKLYWLAVFPQGTVNVQGVLGGKCFPADPVGYSDGGQGGGLTTGHSATFFSPSPGSSIRVSRAYGTLPSTFPAVASCILNDTLGSDGIIPAIGVQPTNNS